MESVGSKIRLVLAGIVFVGLAGVSAKAASFQGLGDLPGGSFESWAYGVSADGSTVVGYGNTGGWEDGDEAFRWTDLNGNGLVDPNEKLDYHPEFGLGNSPSGGKNSEARGVSADGCVVVGYSGTDSGTEAFRWTDLNGNGLVDPNEKLDYHPEFGLGDFPGSSFHSRARGVSADGSVVVGFSYSGSGTEAFRWTDLNGNGLVDPNEKLDYYPEFGLGDLPGGSFSSLALGVSADGSVVVGMSHSASGAEAFRWTDLNGNGLVDPNEKLDYHPEFGLGDLPGGSFNSYAYGVSADGSVVVGRGTSASGEEAFRWEDLNGNGLVDPNEKLDFHPEFGLGDLPGGIFQSYAYDVSADGLVVVGYSSSADTTGGEAFIWVPDANGVRSLKDVLETDFGLDLTGWTLRQAWGISDDGKTIVGRGSSGYWEAWIVTFTCDYNLAGDMNNNCRVEFKDFAHLGAGWQISYYMLDLKEMAADWLIDCFANPSDPACVPK